MNKNLIVAFILVTAAALPAQAWNTELQWNLCEPSAEQALAKLQATSVAQNERSVSYYDTADLTLFNMGIVIRDRDDDKAKERTVKIDVPANTKISKKWKDLDGFKCEYDAHGGVSHLTCSLKHDRTANETDTKGHGPFLTGDQWKFLEVFANKHVQNIVQTAIHIGSLDDNTFEWKAEVGDLALDTLTVDSKTFIEVSNRVDENDAAKVKAQTDKWFQNHGIRLCSNQNAMTEKKLKLLKPIGFAAITDIDALHNFFKGRRALRNGIQLRIDPATPNPSDDDKKVAGILASCTVDQQTNNGVTRISIKGACNSSYDSVGKQQGTDADLTTTVSAQVTNRSQNMFDATGLISSFSGMTQEVKQAANDAGQMQVYYSSIKINDSVKTVQEESVGVIESTITNIDRKTGVQEVTLDVTMTVGHTNYAGRFHTKDGVSNCILNKQPIDCPTLSYAYGYDR